MRVTVFVIAAVVQLAAAAVGFLLLLIGMNGYSERQATPSLLLYIGVGLASAVGLGLASAFAASRLAARSSLGRLGASAVAVVGSSAAGVAILIAAFFGALVLAEVVRGMR